jgi:hypothetical protein
MAGRIKFPDDPFTFPADQVLRKLYSLVQVLSLDMAEGNGECFHFVTIKLLTG